MQQGWFVQTMQYIANQPCEVRAALRVKLSSLLFSGTLASCSPAVRYESSIYLFNFGAAKPADQVKICNFWQMSEKPSSNQNVFEPPTGRCLPATARAAFLGLTSVMCAGSRIRFLMALVQKRVWLYHSSCIKCWGWQVWCVQVREYAAWWLL